MNATLEYTYMTLLETYTRANTIVSALLSKFRQLVLHYCSSPGTTLKELKKCYDEIREALLSSIYTWRLGRWEDI